MTMKAHASKRSASLFITGCLALAMCTALPAQAAEVGNVSASETEKALASTESALLLDPSDRAGVGRLELTETVAVEIPNELEQGVGVQIEDLALSINLPSGGSAGESVELGDGTVAYPGREFSNAVIASEVGIQFLTTIGGAAAPTRFEYQLDLPTGSTIQEAGGGTAIVVDGGGAPMAMVLPAWARDANGVEIATHYAIEGQTLVQYVHHRRHGVTYPVVADPRFEWWGALPTVKLNRSDTYKMRYGSTPTKLSLCVALGGVAGIALAGPCALSIAVLSVKAGAAYSKGRCLRVIIGPGILGGVDYKDRYCR